MKTFRLLASMLVLPLGMAGAADSAPDMLSYRCERVKEVAGNYQRIARYSFGASLAGGH